jgi:surface protein
VSENVDIKTIQAQLDYLKETKSQLKQSLQNKGQLIEDDKPFRDYTENIDKLGSVKIFNSIDEMNSDLTSDNNTIGLIYERYLNEPTFESEMSGGISLPSVIKLDVRGYDFALSLFGYDSIKTNGYGYINEFTLVNDIDESLNIACGFIKYTANGSLRDFYFYMTFKGTTYKYFMNVSEKETGEATYLATREYPDSSVGVYQLKGSELGTYRFSSTTDSNGSAIVPQVLKFFYYGKIHFHNIYSFDNIQNSWKQAPHQFTATAENVTTQNFFGKNGAEVGNLDAIKYVYNDTLPNLRNIHNLYSDLYKSVETSNVTCISHLGNCLGSKYIDYLVFNNLEDCSRAFYTSSAYGVELGNWNMSKVHNASCMFYQLPNWVALNIYNWNVSNLKDASYMFYNLSKISSFPITRWNTHNVVNARGMFANNPGLGYVDWMNLNWANLQDASLMFAYCNNMTVANLCNNSYGWHKAANNITTTAGMFRGCTKLNQVLICGTQGGWRCNNLTNTSFMFSGCSNLNTYFNSYASYANKFVMAIENVTDASSMFAGCAKMYNLEIGNVWYKLENSSGMFNNCTNLRDLSACFWNQVLITNAANMFNNCVSLQNCRVFNNLNFPNLTNGAYMFASTKALNRLTQLYTEPSSMYAPNLETASYMFYMCNNARYMSWNMPNLKSAEYMYCGSCGVTGISMANANLCSLGNFMNIWNSTIRSIYINSGNFDKLYGFYMLNVNNLTNIHVVNNVHSPNLTTIRLVNLPNLTNLTLTGFNLAKMNNVMNFVNNCPNVQIINLAGANFHNVKALSSMILACANLQTINLSGVNLHNVTTMTQSFASLTNLKSLYLNNADLSNVTTMGNTFASTGLVESPLTGMALPNITSLVGVFRDCKQLTAINLADTDMPKLTSIDSITSGCSSLTDANFMNCNAPNITNMVGIFKGCSNLVDVHMDANFTTNVTTLFSAFEQCTKLNFESINNWDTSNVTTMAWTFTGVRDKDHFTPPAWNTEKVTAMNGTFYGSREINELDMTGWNASNVTTMREIFGGMVNINKINIRNLDTSNVLDIGNLFQYSQNIYDIDMDDDAFKNITTVSYMFNNVRNVDLMGKFFSGKTYDHITSMGSLCRYSYGINLNLANASMPNLTGKPSFQNVSGIRQINFDDMHFPILQQYANLGANLSFQNCIYTMRNFYPQTTNSPFPVFYNSRGYMDVMDWSGWNLPNYPAGLYANCISTFAEYGSYPNINIQTMNLSNFNGPQVTYVNWGTVMHVPKTVNYANANFANATYITFNGGRSLQNLCLTGLYSPNIININNMFSYCNNLSDASIQNIIDYFLTLDKVPIANRILTNTNVYSPFYNTNITSSRYSARVAELQSAGWTC